MRMLVRKIPLILLSFSIGFAFSCKATVLREDLVSYSLDYYELQQEELNRRQLLEQQRQVRLDEKKQAALSRWQVRKEKINKFLNNILITLEMKTTYNDNIFRKETKKESDIVNIVTVNANYIPKVDWERKGKTEFFFDFEGDGLTYSTGKADEDTRTGLRTGLNYRITDKYGALLDYQFVKSQATSSGNSEDDDEFVENLTHTFGVKLSAEWGKFPCSLRYQHEISNYEEDFKTSDSQKDVMTLTGNIRISPKTYAFLDYDYGEVSFPEKATSDYSFTTYSLGLRGKLSSKITGVVRVGWGEYDYDIGTKRETENIGGDINYHLSRRFLFKAGGGRSIEASTYTTDDASEQRMMRLQCKYFPPFNKKLSLRGGIKFTNIKFSDSDREDDKTQLKLSAVYGLNKRTKLVLAYTRNARESNVQNRDFTQNIITLKGVFDF